MSRAPIVSRRQKRREARAIRHAGRAIGRVLAQFVPLRVWQSEERRMRPDELRRLEQKNREYVRALFIVGTPP